MNVRKKKNEEEEEFEEEAILSEKLSQERKKQGPKNFFEKTCQCSDILIVDDDLYNLLALRYQSYDIFSFRFAINLT